MHRIVLFSLMALMLGSGIAEARPGWRGGGRGRAKVVVRGGGGVVVKSRGRGPVFRGPVRVTRRVVTRRPVYTVGGHFVFNGGARVAYSRPVIRQRYYDVRVRPQIIVERYPVQPGYIWVNGHWNWNGGEWVWTSGYYAPDPSIRVYYDDGSWE